MPAVRCRIQDDIVGPPLDAAFFFFILRLPPRSTLFPYTTLFRSHSTFRTPHSDNRHRIAVAVKPIPLLNGFPVRSEEHTSELQSLTNLVCRLLLEKKNYSTASPGLIAVELSLSIMSRSNRCLLFDVAYRMTLSGRPSMPPFFFSFYDFHQDLHSFPTRRSSDLIPHSALRIQTIAIASP